MTKTLSLTHPKWATQRFIGFDHLFDELFNEALCSAPHLNYPVHNIIKVTDNKFVIELAVAGFKEGDLSITVEDGNLVVAGSIKTPENTEPREYIHRGISARSFFKSWKLSEHVEVINAGVTNGILTIDLERMIPEEKKAKSIPITYVKE